MHDGSSGFHFSLNFHWLVTPDLPSLKETYRPRALDSYIYIFLTEIDTSAGLSTWKNRITRIIIPE